MYLAVSISVPYFDSLLLILSTNSLAAGNGKASIVSTELIRVSKLVNFVSNTGLFKLSILPFTSFITAGATSLFSFIRSIILFISLLIGSTLAF